MILKMIYHAENIPGLKETHKLEQKFEMGGVEADELGVHLPRNIGDTRNLGIKNKIANLTGRK